MSALGLSLLHRTDALGRAAHGFPARLPATGGGRVATSAEFKLLRAVARAYVEAAAAI
jgi:hypothetical protein